MKILVSKNYSYIDNFDTENPDFDFSDFQFSLKKMAKYLKRYQKVKCVLIFDDEIEINGVPDEQS